MSLDSVLNRDLQEFHSRADVVLRDDSETLSRYAKCAPATAEQIRNFTKALAVNFQNQNSLFWQMLIKELTNMQVTYQFLRDVYRHLTRNYPYPTITLQTVLGFNTTIKTYSASELGSIMELFPDKRFAAIYNENSGRYIYSTLEEAQKTNAEYIPIDSLNERRELPC